MAKKVILAIILILILSVLCINFTINNTVNVYIDGENVSVKTTTLNQNIDSESLNGEICDYTINVMNDAWVANPWSEVASFVAYALLIVYLVKASMKVK